jgi:hypothetical protein
MRKESLGPVSRIQSIQTKQLYGQKFGVNNKSSNTPNRIRLSDI